MLNPQPPIIAEFRTIRRRLSFTDCAAQRERLGVTQSRLAAAVGVSWRTLSRVENLGYGKPALVIKLRQALTDIENGAPLPPPSYRGEPHIAAPPQATAPDQRHPVADTLLHLLNSLDDVREDVQYLALSAKRAPATVDELAHRLSDWADQLRARGDDAETIMMERVIAIAAGACEALKPDRPLLRRTPF